MKGHFITVDEERVEEVVTNINTHLDRMKRITRRKKQKVDIVKAEQDKLQELLRDIDGLWIESGVVNDISITAMQLHTSILSMMAKMKYRMGKAKYQSCEYHKTRTYNYKERYNMPYPWEDEYVIEYYCEFNKRTKWGSLVDGYGYSEKRDMIESLCETCDIHGLTEEQIIALEMIR